MEDKNKQPGEPLPDEQVSAEEQNREPELATGEESGQESVVKEAPETARQTAEPAAKQLDADSKEPAASEAGEAIEQKGSLPEHAGNESDSAASGGDGGEGQQDERAFDTMELKLLDQLDTEKGKETAKSKEEQPKAAEEQPDAAEEQPKAAEEQPDGAEKGETGASAGQGEEGTAEKPYAPEKEESAAAPAVAQSGQEDPASVIDEAAEKAEAGQPGQAEPAQAKSAEESEPRTESEREAAAEKTGETQDQAVSLKPAGAEASSGSGEAASRQTEDTGVMTAIRKEIRNTPKPKKILVGAIAAAMILAGAVGFSAYATQSGTSVPGGSVQAEQPVKQPAKLHLTLEGKKFELDLYSIGYDGKNPATIDQMKLRKWLDQVKMQVNEEPKNAYQKRIWNRIIPEKPGRKMDIRTVETWLKDLKPFLNKPTEIPMVAVQPSVTAADLKKVNSKLIGKYTTRFDPGNVNRTINIKLAAKAIDGLILMPDETFSFNRVVGPRTARRGYKPAPVIVKGEYSEGIGGGICQVSSTLFNSVDEAGLKITRRSSHSKEVTYVPPGRDATVSWGGPDFRFKNNLNMPVLIRIKVSGSYLTVYTYTVPGAKVVRKKVPQAPESFTTITVDPNKPTESLPKTGQ